MAELGVAVSEPQAIAILEAIKRLPKGTDVTDAWLLGFARETAK
jgi:hypothetical protein